MSKLNKAGAAKRAAQSKQHTNGNVNVNGQYQAQYSQGIDAYHSGCQYSECWSCAKQQGWRRALQDDKNWYERTGNPDLKKKIEHRIHRAFGIVSKWSVAA